MTRPTPGSPRVLSLDVFRGVAIAAMILVNKPGNHDAAFPVLRHASWHGATPTDWIFPFFLFIVGVALPYSIEQRRKNGATNPAILTHALTRSLLLFALGVFEKNFPFLGTTLDTFRIPGVLQRIALCYFAGTVLTLHATRLQQSVVAALLLLGYWALLAFVPVPGAGVVSMTRELASASWPAWIDQLVMGRHLGHGNQTWDANGLLSSVPAVVTVQSGIFAAWILRAGADTSKALFRLAGVGVVAVLAGWLWGGLAPMVGPGILGEPRIASAAVFPINKLLWTSSYVLYTSGLGMIALASCVWAVDLHPRTGWARAVFVQTFVFLGTNAIFAYVASAIVAKLLQVATVDAGGGPRVSVWDWAYQHGFAAAIPDAALASLVQASAYALLWVAICGWMYQRRVFWKL